MSNHTHSQPGTLERFATKSSEAGIEGQCPRCLSLLMPRAGGWRGLVDMATLEKDDRLSTVYFCIMCGYYEDSVIRANRLAQHMEVKEGAAA